MTATTSPRPHRHMDDRDVEMDFWRAKALELQEALQREIAAHAALRERMAKHIAEERLDASLRALDD